MNEIILPKGFTGFLVRKFVSDPLDIQNEKTRAQYGYLGGSVSCVINLILTGLKIALGVWIGSKALVADGLHSGSDMLTSAIVIYGFWMAKKPRDEEHPFGHANAELIAGLIMSVLLIVAGFELLRDNAVDLWAGEYRQLDASWGIILAVGSTILFKEWLFAFSKGLSKVIVSPALDADAWHHRMDSLTTVAVIFGLLGNMAGYPWLDPAVGLVVSLMVIWSGVEIAKDSISPLLGENVGKETIREIVDLVLMSDEIYNAHDIYVHTYGQNHFISMHVEILGTLSPVAMHDVAAEAQSRVEKRFGGACTIHVDPADVTDERYINAASVLKSVVTEHRELLDYHDLQFREFNDHCKIFFEFSIDPQVDEGKYPALEKVLELELKEKFQEYTPCFTLEPGYNLAH